MDNRYFDYPGAQVGPEHYPGAEPVELGLLAGSGEAEWSLLFDYGDRRVVPAGEKIIEQGTVGRSLVIVLIGSFQIMTGGRRGRSAVMRSLEPGDVVGEIGFAVGGPRSHTIRASTPGEIFELEWDSFARLAAAHPALGIKFLSDVVRIIAARARTAER